MTLVRVEKHRRYLRDASKSCDITGGGENVFFRISATQFTIFSSYVNFGFYKVLILVFTSPRVVVGLTQILLHISTSSFRYVQPNEVVALKRASSAFWKGQGCILIYIASMGHKST